MVQEIYYSLRFNLNENGLDRDNLFSAINFFAQLYGRLDKMLITPLPLSLEFSRSLKDFGDSSFLFVFKDQISYPDQLSLGSLPDREIVENWMNRSRKMFSSCFQNNNSDSFSAIKGDLDRLAIELGFSDLLSYRTLELEELDNMVIDFKNAQKFLDSEVGVIIFE